MLDYAQAHPLLFSFLVLIAIALVMRWGGVFDEIAEDDDDELEEERSSWKDDD